jgi:hypothetical protein
MATAREDIMRTIVKVSFIVVMSVLELAGVTVAWLALHAPAHRPPSTEKVEPTRQRLARGQYLVDHVADCEGCHSDHLWDRWGMPPRPGARLAGGFLFDEKFGVPGTVSAQNLTPDPETGKGNWTDGELMRAFREGVSRDGHALFPMMPYERFRDMSDEDARSVVAYLRTYEPVRHRIAPARISFPANLLMKLAPRPVDGPVRAPDDQHDHLGYGRYLVTLAGCQECHTPRDAHGKLVGSLAFAGGQELRGPWGRVVSANLTPDSDTFVGQATRDEFIGRFKSFESLAANPPPAPPGRNTVMPWLAFSGMTERDLGAIYDYLRTLPPIKHAVVTFPDAPALVASAQVAKGGDQ